MTKHRTETNDELLNRVEIEQALREEWIDKDTEDLRLKVLAQDTENTEFLKKFIELKGWPKISIHGKEVAMAAWLIAQHSPEKDFRKRCLDLMQQSPAEVEPYNLVRTIDRVRLDEGRPQYFGTNFTLTEDGLWAPFPIEDVQHVNERRAKYGLPTIEEKTQEYNNQG